MTMIAGRGLAALSAMQAALPRLAIGQRVEATVLGPTRQGVSVMIGQEKLQLDVPSRLTNAGTLTLEGASSSSAAGQRVRIVAADDKVLTRSIPADLRSGPKPVSQVASAIVEKGLIRVTAQPLAPDGKAAGQDVTLHLKAGSYDLAGKAMAERSSAFRPAESASTTDVETPLPRAPVRQVEADPSQRGQSEVRQTPDGVGRVRDRRSSTSLSQPAPADGRTPIRNGSLPLQTSPSAPGVPSPPASGLVRTMPGEAPLAGMPSEGHQRTTSTIGNASPAIKTIAASAVSAYQNEAEMRAVRDPMATPDNPRSIDRGSDARGYRPIPAIVVDRTETGKVVLNVAGQRYRIEQPIDLPTGTPLQVIPASTKLAPGGGNQGDFQNAGLQLARLVEILDDIDRAGRQAAEANQPNRVRQLPLPDRNLASKFLGLLSAGHGASSPAGRTHSSSGQAGLAMARRDQIETLVRELGAMASEPLEESWKSVTLPLGLDTAQAVSFFFRERDFDAEGGAAEGEADHSETQRAVFDISFSRLGRCQIDALCQEGRFDLLIRSEHLLSEGDRQEIATLFASACEIAGVTGEIGFKVGGFFEPARSSAAGKDLRT